MACLALLITLELNDAYGMSWRKRLEQGAYEQLRLIGSAQLAYSDANLNRDYGSFHQLVAAQFLPAEATRESLIPEYTLATFSYFSDHGYGCYSSSTFTVIALPRRLGLRTFAICDDQTLRVAPSRGVEITGTSPDTESENRREQLRAYGLRIPDPTCPIGWPPVVVP